jgi:hypothetical protein
MRGLDTERLAGSIVAVPVVNPESFRGRTPFVSPADGKNLNRCFPGDPQGTFSDVLADLVFRRFVHGSDALLDLHGGDMVEALEPFALYDASPVEERSLEIARAFGLPWVVRAGGLGVAGRRHHQRRRGALGIRRDRRGRRLRVARAARGRGHVRGIARVLDRWDDGVESVRRRAAMRSTAVWCRSVHGGGGSGRRGRALVRPQVSLGTVSNLHGEELERIEPGKCSCSCLEPHGVDGLLLTARRASSLAD